MGHIELQTSFFSAFLSLYFTEENRQFFALFLGVNCVGDTMFDFFRSLFLFFYKDFFFGHRFWYFLHIKILFIIIVFTVSMICFIGNVYWQVFVVLFFITKGSTNLDFTTDFDLHLVFIAKDWLFLWLFICI